MKMLARSASAPILKSIWTKEPSSSSSSSPDPLTLRAKASPFSFSTHHPVTIQKTLSRTASGLHLRDTPTPTPKTKTKPFHNGYSQFVSENQENGSDMSLGMSTSVSWDAALDERCSAPVDGSGIGGGGGGCDGRGGCNDDSCGGDGGGEHGFQSTDEYYQKIIQDNPHNPLFLGNYAKFLKEVSIFSNEIIFLVFMCIVVIFKRIL